MSNSHSSYSFKKRQPVRLPDGRVVGQLHGDAFVKTVSASRHRLKQPPAWAIQAEVYDEIRPMIASLVIADKETDVEYHASAETFDRFKGELDRGFGRQYYLPLKHWEIRDNGNRQLALW